MLINICISVKYLNNNTYEETKKSGIDVGPSVERV